MAPVLRIYVHHNFINFLQLQNTDWAFDYQYLAIRLYLLCLTREDEKEHGWKDHRLKLIVFICNE